MTLPILLDIGIALLLLFFAIRGIQQGFVRALCSFLAVFVALFGSIFLSKSLTPLVTDIAAPHFLPTIMKQLEAGSVPLPSQNLFSPETSNLLQHLGLPDSWSQMLQNFYTSSIVDQLTNTSPTQLFANFILEIIISALIFILSFILLLILWRIVSRSLDLVARLPVLNFCNRTLGALLGICKGILLLLILRWILCDLLDQIPPELIDRTYLFQWLTSHLPKLNIHKFLL